MTWKKITELSNDPLAYLFQQLFKDDPLVNFLLDSKSLREKAHQNGTHSPNNCSEIICPGVRKMHTDQMDHTFCSETSCTTKNHQFGYHDFCNPAKCITKAIINDRHINGHTYTCSYLNCPEIKKMHKSGNHLMCRDDNCKLRKWQKLIDLADIAKEAKNKTSIFIECPSCKQNNFILKPSNSSQALQKIDVSLRAAYCNNPRCNDRREILVAYDSYAQGFIDWAKWANNPKNINFVLQKNQAPLEDRLQQWFGLNPKD